jgi:alkyldihydroxyacetonephosphate synthase
VICPADELEIQRVVDAAVAAGTTVIFPFGGGSNIVGSLEPLAEDAHRYLHSTSVAWIEVIDIDEG